MKEGFLILLVLLFLIGLTALRYRKGIMAVIRFSRAVRSARGEQGAIATPARKEIGQLVRCSKCGTWVPSDRARKVGRNTFCSNECVSAAAK
jgi:hypothetical protein